LSPIVGFARWNLELDTSTTRVVVELWDDVVWLAGIGYRLFALIESVELVLLQVPIAILST
jgi:hypothetical protein